MALYNRPLLGAIDQGTSSSRFLVIDPESCEVVEMHQEEIKQITPEEGWMEEDPGEILSSVLKCIQITCEKCVKKGIDINRIKGVGITNQRETTIMWDSTTGQWLHNAIVWCDNRAAGLADRYIEMTPTQRKDYFQIQCGLPIHPYFSALKIRWLMDNCGEVQEAIQEKRCSFGTVDTWLIWNLTGGHHGGRHVTDVSNANRTMLMGLESLAWDDKLCAFFNIPKSILPQIASSAEVYGYFIEGPLKGVPICGCLGDQSAALVGQNCLKQGMAKNTYGTGCFLLYNTGTRPSVSHHGLLTTVAYQLGPNREAYYALEGSIAVGGQVVRWLRDKLGLIKESKEIGALAEAVDSTAGVYFVPAFNGLYAPHWDPTARGLIIGLTQYSDKHHIARAALEAVCYQTREILEAMSKDSGISISTLHVDGGMTVNDLLLQLQADIIGMQVVRNHMVETTALGAAIAAGVALGISNLDASRPPVNSDTFCPTTSSDEQDLGYSKWKEAVKRSLAWEIQEDIPPSSSHFLPLAAVGTTLALVGSVLAAVYFARR